MTASDDISGRKRQRQPKRPAGAPTGLSVTYRYIQNTACKGTAAQLQAKVTIPLLFSQPRFFLKIFFLPFGCSRWPLFACSLQLRLHVLPALYSRLTAFFLGSSLPVSCRYPLHELILLIITLKITLKQFYGTRSTGCPYPFSAPARSRITSGRTMSALRSSPLPSPLR